MDGESLFETEGFTGSGVVFAEKDGGIVTEKSATKKSPSERQRLLLAAETATVEAGGNVLRLAGLYSSTRVPVQFWMKTGKVSGSEDGLVNLIHYEDAATLVVAVLFRRLRGMVLLGCDNQALTRQEIAEAALDMPDFASHPMPEFNVAATNSRTGRAGDEKGKIYNNTATRELTGWSPRWKTF